MYSTASYIQLYKVYASMANLGVTDLYKKFLNFKQE